MVVRCLKRLCGFLICLVSIEIMMQSGAVISHPNLKAWHHESVDTWFVGKSQVARVSRPGWA